MPAPNFNLAYAMTLPPQAALAYFKAKGYVVTGNWKELWQQAHDNAFTVANCARLDVLADIRDALESALAEGITYREFLTRLTPVLQAKGWWGKAVDMETGEILQTHHKDSTVPVEYGSPHRLKTIYQTNLQSAYMAGRHKEMTDVADSMPYWQYIAVMDSRTRPTHAAMNGRVFRHDDAIWGTHYPPNGFNCRCRVRALSDGDLRRKDLSLSKSNGHTRDVEVPVSGRNPKAGKTTVTVYQASDMARPFAPDPGWNYAPGARSAQLADMLAQKLAASGEAVQSAARHTKAP